jgi:60 kDa SS-A/Ro ribonucleoprotein
MRKDPLAAVTTIATPDSQKIPGRPGMVRNAAGGYVWEKNSWDRLADFNILGTTGGTFYLDERKLTLRNTELVLAAAQEDGARAVRIAAGINTSRPPKAPGTKPQLFTLAAVMAMGDADAKLAARRLAVEGENPMLRTTDQLTDFAGYFKQLHGKQTPQGAGLSTGQSVLRLLRGYFLNPDVEQVTWRALKARQRKTPSGENMSLRDVLRIAHPKADSAERAALFGWLAGNVSDDAAREMLPAVDKYLRAQAVTKAADAIAVVNELKVPWEFLPSGVLDDPRVWDALVDTVGLTALLRNLARMSRIGTFDAIGNGAVHRAINRLVDPGAVVRARIHPMQVWLAQRVYMSGQSAHKGGRVMKTLNWAPNPRITDALGTMWENSFGAVVPTGKRHLVVIDSSGSMTWDMVTANGSEVGNAYTVANTMALILARTEPETVVINADTSVHPSQITPATQLKEIPHMLASGGGTALAAGFEWAAHQRLNVDGVVLFSDMETWAGQMHSAQAWKQYQRQVNPDARAVFATLVPTGHTIADPGDESALNVVGVNASLPQIVAGWVR